MKRVRKKSAEKEAEAARERNAEHDSFPSYGYSKFFVCIYHFPFFLSSSLPFFASFVPLTLPQCCVQGLCGGSERGPRKKNRSEEKEGKRLPDSGQEEEEEEETNTTITTTTAVHQRADNVSYLCQRIHTSGSVLRLHYKEGVDEGVAESYSLLRSRLEWPSPLVSGLRSIGNAQMKRNLYILVFIEHKILMV